MKELGILLLRQALSLGKDKVATSNSYCFVDDDSSLFRQIWEVMCSAGLALKETVQLDNSSILVSFSATSKGIQLALDEDEKLSEEVELDTRIIEAKSKGCLVDFSNYVH